MDKRWFLTVGVPGGEYAVKAADIEQARVTTIKRLADDDVQPINIEMDDKFHIWYRPAPSDLVDWLNTKMGMFFQSETTNRLSESALLKAPSGWMHYESNVPETKEFDRVFIPVVLSQGITVIQDG